MARTDLERQAAAFRHIQIAFVALLVGGEPCVCRWLDFNAQVLQFRAWQDVETQV